MIKRIVFVLTLLALLVACGGVEQASATCPIEGQHTSGGGVVGAAGAQAFLFQAATSGCFLYITHIQANMLQTGSTAGTAVVAYWLNTTCTGTPTYQLMALGVPGTARSTANYEFKADGNGALRTGGSPGGSLCVGFVAGATGVIESVSWEGMWSANVL